MKKVIGIIMILAGLIAGCLGLSFLFFGTSTVSSQSQAVSVIGGANGPTAVFVAGKADHSSMIISMIALIALALLLVIAGIFLIVYHIKNQED